MDLEGVVVGAGQSETAEGLEGVAQPHRVVGVAGDGGQSGAGRLQPGGGDGFGAEERTEAEQSDGVRVAVVREAGDGDADRGGQRRGMVTDVALLEEACGVRGQKPAVAVQGHAAAQDSRSLGEREGQVAEVLRQEIGVLGGHSRDAALEVGEGVGAGEDVQVALVGDPVPVGVA